MTRTFRGDRASRAREYPAPRGTAAGHRKYTATCRTGAIGVAPTTTFTCACLKKFSSLVALRAHQREVK